MRLDEPAPVVLQVVGNKDETEMQKRQSSKRRAKLLAGYYSVAGDGVAHANLDQMLKAKRFRDSVRRLGKANLVQTEQEAPDNSRR